MFAFKKKYFLIISNFEDINLDKIRINEKIIIVYRNLNYPEKIGRLIRFRNKCRLKRIKFYVANDKKMCLLLKSDGIYISSYNKDFKAQLLRQLKIDIIGSAHNIFEINLKIKQGCKNIIVSKLFKVDYDLKSTSYGISKFNYLLKFNKNLIPLGGIKCSNLNSLKNVASLGFAILSEVKKKPVIANRLF